MTESDRPSSRYSAARIGEIRQAIEGKIPTVVAIAERSGQTGLSRKFLIYTAKELVRAGLEGAAIDELTGLPRRNMFMRQTEPLAAEVRRNPSQRGLHVIHADADNFAPFNRAYGQRQGDTALRTLGDLIRATMRDTDIAARIGGEEFAVASPVEAQVRQTPGHRNVHPAERLRIAVDESRLGEGKAHLTVSVGTTEYLPHEELADTMDRADRAHLIAKMLGKNRTVSASVRADGRIVYRDLTHRRTYTEEEVDGLPGLVSGQRRFQIIIDESGAKKPELRRVPRSNL